MNWGGILWLLGAMFAVVVALGWVASVYILVRIVREMHSQLKGDDDE